MIAGIKLVHNKGNYILGQRWILILILLELQYKRQNMQVKTYIALVYISRDAIHWTFLLQAQDVTENNWIKQVWVSCIKHNCLYLFVQLGST